MTDIKIWGGYPEPAVQQRSIGTPLLLLLLLLLLQLLLLLLLLLRL